jgi:hypothetical protein
MTQEHCEIKTEEDGSITAVSSEVALTIIPEFKDDEVKAFNRNAKRVSVGGGEELSHDRCLVGELNGVRIYVCESGKNLILTTKDLYL